MTPSIGFVPADNTFGNYVINNGYTWLELQNIGGVDLNVDVYFSETVDGHLPEPVSYEVEAGERGSVGPFPREFYGETLEFLGASPSILIKAWTLDV